MHLPFEDFNMSNCNAELILKQFCQFCTSDLAGLSLTCVLYKVTYLLTYLLKSTNQVQTVIKANQFTIVILPMPNKEKNSKFETDHLRI